MKDVTAKIEVCPQDAMRMMVALEGRATYFAQKGNLPQAKHYDRLYLVAQEAYEIAAQQGEK